MSDYLDVLDLERHVAAALRELAEAVRTHARRREVLVEELHLAWRGPSAERHRALAAERQLDANALATRLDADADSLAHRVLP